MPKCEFMRTELFQQITKMNHDEMRELEEKGLVKIKVESGLGFISLNTLTKNMIKKVKPNYFPERFEQTMPNGVTYYGFMGKICTKELMRNED